MRISLIAVGTRMPQWVESGVAEYRRRLPPEWQFDLREVAMAKRGRNPDISRARQQEGAALLKAVPAGDRIVALAVDGKALSTEQLASRLGDWQMDAVNISLLVGGPDGLAAECLAAADWRWSLSLLTLPHPLVRIVVVEQLYRAWTINTHHPYHR